MSLHTAIRCANMLVLECLLRTKSVEHQRTMFTGPTSNVMVMRSTSNKMSSAIYYTAKNSDKKYTLLKVWHKDLEKEKKLLPVLQFN